MSRTRVKSLKEAIDCANELKASKRRLWFRGQRKDWPVKSTFMRIPREQHESTMRRINRFEAWVKETPGLEQLAADLDSVYAVAQHYGLPTNFVDFTTSAEIAAYFATEGADVSPPGEMACLICLDVEDMLNFWDCLPDKYPPPEFLEPDIPNLWRLETQKGRFLFCPYDQIEMLYDFDRIYFPRTHPYTAIREEEIYPTRKSHLEILLDQYFMNEKLLEKHWEVKGATRIVIELPQQGSYTEVFSNGIPRHSSWSEDVLRGWIAPFQEKLGSARTAVNFHIDVTHPDGPERTVQRVADQLLRDLMSFTDIRKKLVNWVIESRGDLLPPKITMNLPLRLNRLWDGLRRLPHSDEDLCQGMAMCVALGIALEGDFNSSGGPHLSTAAKICLRDPMEVEFGARDGSYSRSFASRSNIAAAVRSDISVFAAAEWKERIGSNMVHLLQTAWVPSQVFDFSGLARLFAREIAPMQVLIREAAVFYSPARLDKFGLP
jgi:FRG domain